MPLSKRIVASVVASTGSVAFYLVTTAGQKAIVVISAVGPNFLTNVYAADGSFRHLGDLLGEKKYKEFVATLITGFGLAAPQGFIAYTSSAADKPLIRYLAMGSTVAGTAVLNGLALKDLSGILSNVHALGQTFSFRVREMKGWVLEEEKDRFYLRKNVLENLQTLSKSLETFDYKQLNGDQVAALLTTDSQSAKHLTALQMVYDLANTASKPYEHGNFSSAMAFIFATALKLSLAAVMLVCIFAYSCATAAGLEKNFSLSNAISAFLGVTLMSPTMLLAITGGFSLGASVIDLVATMLQGKIPNEFTLGKIGVFTTLLAPVLATALAFYSGYTTELLFGKCAKTPLNAIMGFPDGAFVANVSSAVFNAVYTQKCLRLFFAAVTARCMGAESTNFLAVQTVLAEIMRVAKSNPEQFVLDLESEASGVSAREAGQASDRARLVQALKSDPAAFRATIWAKTPVVAQEATLATPLLSPPASPTIA